MWQNPVVAAVTFVGSAALMIALFAGAFRSAVHDAKARGTSGPNVAAVILALVFNVATVLAAVGAAPGIETTNALLVWIGGNLIFGFALACGQRANTP